MVTGEVGAGKTVAVRAALASLEPTRHQIIYIADPTITMRGIHTAIVTALGGQPAFYSGVLASQTARLLAGELDGVPEALATTDRTVAAVASGAARYGGSVAKLLPPAENKEA